MAGSGVQEVESGRWETEGGSWGLGAETWGLGIGGVEFGGWGWAQGLKSGPITTPGGRFGAVGKSGFKRHFGVKH